MFLSLQSGETSGQWHILPFCLQSHRKHTLLRARDKVLKPFSWFLFPIVEGDCRPNLISLRSDVSSIFLVDAVQRFIFCRDGSAIYIPSRRLPCERAVSPILYRQYVIK